MTAFILPSGRILRRLGDGRGGGTPGFITAEIGVPTTPRLTPYARHGDAFFAQPCAGYVLALAIVIALRRRSRGALVRK